ncbi:helix-turn-helix transcriptional regulator [Priestia aryabhattai]|uniref:helix-turn-helix domain-containing protein n=1 Tax=Priestia aryabhattai TaxID=412384 RepID=UPI002E223953|nr:helix-turn-helix transcriptional regulator [Priestia aryabhattai]MED4257735.1 helix-turn-helix transcriptional regulator [Priestia aryabhattai]
MLGKRIAKLRKEKGLSQYELAERLGFSRGKLANYEQGSRQPDYDTLQLIATYFDVSTDYLLGKSDIPSTSATNNNIIDTLTGKDEKDIAKRMEKIKEDLSNDDGYMLMGEPMSEEAKESILDAMEYAIRQAKRINKKYIPKKYRNNQE